VRPSFRPANPNQVNAGQIDSGQVRPGEVVKGSCQKRGSESFRNKYAELRTESFDYSAGEVKVDAEVEAEGAGDIGVADDAEAEVEVAGEGKGASEVALQIASEVETEIAGEDEGGGAEVVERIEVACGGKVEVDAAVADGIIVKGEDEGAIEGEGQQTGNVEGAGERTGKAEGASEG
jgi:hypothetical protein